MNLNLVDCFIIAIIVLSLASGFRQGLIKALGGIIGIAAGVILASAYYDNLALYLEDYYGIITRLADFFREKLFFASLPVGAGFIPDPSLARFAAGDIAYYLASFLVLGLSFLLLFLFLSKIVRFFWNGLDQVFMAGFLEGINRIAGMAVVSIKNLIIIMVFLGFLLPWIKTGSDIGIATFMIVEQGINNSYLAGIMLGIFEEAKHFFF